MKKLTFNLFLVFLLAVMSAGSIDSAYAVANPEDAPQVCDGPDGEIWVFVYGQDEEGVCGDPDSAGDGLGQNNLDGLFDFLLDGLYGDVENIDEWIHMWLEQMIPAP